MSDVRWEDAELDGSNSDLYQVAMSGDDVDWEWRDAPDFYTAKGLRRDGTKGQADKLRRPAAGTVTLRARSEQEARAAVIRAHPEYHTVESVTKIG